MKTSNKKQGIVFSITSVAGGTGKTTLSLVLGHYLSNYMNKSVAIVDIAPTGTMRFHVNTPSQSILNWIFHEEQDFSQEHVLSGKLNDPEFDADLYLAPKSPESSKEFNPEYLSNMLLAMRPMYDYIIIDSGMYDHSEESKMVRSMSDRVIFTINDTVPHAFALSRMISHDDVPKDKLRVIANAKMGSVGLNDYKINLAAQGVPILGSTPFSPNLVVSAISQKELPKLLSSKTYHEGIEGIVRSLVDDLDGRSSASSGKDSCHTTLISSMRPGDGKSVVGILLAHADAKNNPGKKVLLMDLSENYDKATEYMKGTKPVENTEWMFSSFELGIDTYVPNLVPETAIEYAHYSDILMRLKDRYDSIFIINAKSLTTTEERLGLYFLNDADAGVLITSASYSGTLALKHQSVEKLSEKEKEKIIVVLNKERSEMQDSPPSGFSEVVSIPASEKLIESSFSSLSPEKVLKDSKLNKVFQDLLESTETVSG